MTGIFGFSGYFEESIGENLLTNMAEALKLEDVHSIHLYHETGFGIGNWNFTNLETHPQLIWNEEKNLCLAVDGEIFNTEALKHKLKSNGIEIKTGSFQELALRLYTLLGEGFASELNGIFSIAIWDCKKQKLILINDRLGLNPIYYAQTKHGFLFGSRIRAFLADPHLNLKVDSTAIAQFLTFDHVLDDRTLLSNVRLLPQASVLTFFENNLEIQPYWNLEYPSHYEFKSQPEYLEELIYHLRNAVRRQSQGNLAKGLLLSGGMDSRFLLALLGEQNSTDQLHTFTWGIPGCDDARIARELSNKMGGKHHFFELKPEYLQHKANEAVRLTDGMGNIINLHALATLEEETQYAQIIYKGFLGDAMMGFALRPPFWGDYCPETIEEVHLDIHEYQGVFYYDRMEQKKLFTNSFSKQVGDTVFKAYSKAMLRSNHYQLAIQRLYFDITQRVPRHTLNGVAVTRSRAIVRLPFSDSDLLDFSLTVPPGYQFNRHLMKLAFVQSFPALAKIPLSDTGLPMVACSRDILLRSKQLLQWHINNRGPKWISWPTRRPYKDYANWFRTILRPWVESTLLNQNSLQRGYFNPDYIINLVNEHMSGVDRTVNLGALLTLELWHQQFID